MICKIKRLSKTAQIPIYQTQGASGFDLHADETCEIAPLAFKAIKTGIALELERGYELQVRPRSGLAIKYGVTVLNAPGTIDNDYRGEIQVILINHSQKPFRVQQGDRIAQGVVCHVNKVDFVEVTVLDDTQRGTGGFGSTDK